jgi:hypothetical protein
MKQPLRTIKQAGLAALAAALGAACGATAQAPAVVPIPFANTVAGLAAGSGNTACTTMLPTAFGTAVAGDGCPATQATLNDPYGVFVDGYGNVYFGDYNNYSLRVIYMGGANLAAALQAANPTHTFTPQVGYVYTLAGSRTAALSDVTPPGGGAKNYYCNGISGAFGLNNKGDNCPATYAYLKPRNPYVDAYGNVLFTTASGAALRVVYVGGAQMAALIQILDGVPPQVGYSYSIISSSSNGYAGDGLTGTNSGVHVYQERDVAMDSAGNIYMSDGENAFTAPAYLSNNNIRMVNATTGLISTYAGAGGCTEGATSTNGCSGVYGGDGGLATSATLNSPYTIFFDRYDNLYITDYNEGRVRVVYKGGSMPGLGSSLTPGNIYTVVGGGTLTASGSPATQLSLGVVDSGGIDASGNLYVVDGTKSVIWRVDANTGIAVIIAGGKSGQTKGAFCSGGTTGPLSLDNYGDGCPAVQGSVLPGGKVAFDRLGNFYEADSNNNVIRKFSYNTVFPATAVGSNVTQSLALTSPAGTTLNGETFALQGGVRFEFSDAGFVVDTCTGNSTIAAGGVCVFGINFAPTAAGLRIGNVQIAATGGGAANFPVGGDGLAANTSVDPASVTNLGFTQTTSITGYNVTNEVVTFNAANSLIAGQLVTISGFPTSTFLNGQTFTVQAQGLSSTQFEAAFIYANVSQTTESGKGTYYGGLTPTGVYADSNGNVFASDGGGNRLVKLIAPSPGIASVMMTGLSKPSQVAEDGIGNVYVADAGNNRIAMTGPAGGTITALGTGLSAPQGVAVDIAGNVYVADTGNNRVVELPAGGAQTTVNITGLSKPTAIAIDGADDLFVLDSGNNRIVKLPLNFEQSTVNLGTTAITPTGIAVDAAGDLYLSDSSSDSVVEFAPGSVNGNQLVTGLISPLGVAVDLNGSLYVADSSQTSVLAANRAQPVTPFPDTNINTSNTAPLNVTNTGNVTLAFNGATTTTATGNTAAFAVTAASSGGCTTATTLASGSACGLVATFTPTVKNTNYSETLSLVTNAANAASSGALLTGTGVFLIGTTTTIAVTQPTTPTINYAQAVTVSITIVPASNAGAAPTGVVKITVDGKLQSQNLPSNGVATVTLNPAVGTHVVSASYSGDVNYASSSNSYSFTVLKAVTTTALTIAVGSQGANPTLTFTANVASTTATGETGTVSFYSGTTLLSTMNVTGTTAGATASYTTQTTVYSPFSFSAVYSGDSNFSTSTSATVTPAPDYTVVVTCPTSGASLSSSATSTPTTSCITVPQGGVGTLPSIITPLYSYSGTITATCSGLPANTICRFFPTSVPLGGSLGTGGQSFNVYFYTNTNPNIATMEAPGLRGQGRGIYAATAFPLMALALVWLRRRKGLVKHIHLLSAVMLVLLAAGGFAAVSGCGGSSTSVSSSSGFITPTGATASSVLFTDSNGNKHTVNLMFTVNSPYSLP